MSVNTQYQHDSLDNPETQIRLLQILPADKADPIIISIQTFYRSSAPSYSALSYTWGDANLSKRILANGCTLDVTEHCWYALGQLRLTAFADYYWIDQISINQADRHEKSAQVSLMGDTFRAANCVLVSLGRHTKETAFLFSQLSSKGASYNEADQIDDIQVDEWIKTMDMASLETLLSSFKVFGSLEYWKRLWTAQEFALPATVIILCGNGCLPWNRVFELHAMLCKQLRVNHDYYRGQMAFSCTEQTLQDLPMTETKALRSTVRNTLPRLAPFSQVVLKFGMRHCADVKDRIYGLLSLVEWPEDQPKLSADYSRSRTDLALHALERADSGKDVIMSYRVLSMLEIPLDDPQMATLNSHRSLQHQDPVDPDTCTELPVTFPDCDFYFHITDDAPTGSQQPWKTVRIEPRTLGMLQNDGRIWEFLEEHPKFYASSLLRPGDIILKPKKPVVGEEGHDPYYKIVKNEIDKIYDRAALVLRESSRERYEIIGHARILFDTSPNTTLVHAMPPIDLHISKEDLLFWTWQLRNRKDLNSLGRHVLATNFCGRPGSSYAIGRKVSTQAVLHDTALAAARVTQNGPAVRQKLALRKIG